MRQNKNTLVCIGESRPDQTGDFPKFCGSGVDWIQFHRIRTGLGQKNFTVRSSLAQTRGGTGSRGPESTQAGFWIFLSDPDLDLDLESKIWDKPDPEPESVFNFGSSKGLCGLFLSKNMGKLQLGG